MTLKPATSECAKRVTAPGERRSGSPRHAWKLRWTDTLIVRWLFGMLRRRDWRITSYTCRAGMSLSAPRYAPQGEGASRQISVTIGRNRTNGPRALCLLVKHFLSRSAHSRFAGGPHGSWRSSAAAAHYPRFPPTPAASVADALPMPARSLNACLKPHTAAPQPTRGCTT